ncbi:AAA family ATPase [Microcoleus sp. MOSTC5]|uniref:PAS domain S-box protein n=1 Tax=Microcoleus sp. MOSTC5 TaxID=3055378 RepID=UPI002FD0A5AD
MNNFDKNSDTPTNVQIPNYQIISTVYSGSRTLVYRAIRTSDQLPVVIKILKNDYPTFSELVQFRNQYTITKNLNSPSIVQTYSLEPYENGYALVMEDFGGISLQEWAIKGKNALSLREFLSIAIALCNTLDLLYRERIIHKDIKPSNILINPETKQVKLIDFSIASLLPRETQTLINPNVLEGTLAYISPEQTGRMNRGIDYRTDFYSLGVTFYELLTVKLPFESNDPMELVHSHIAKASPLVHEINSQIPFVLSQIVTKLMAKNAESRYQSALGIKFDLENCLTQLQVTGSIESFEIAQRDVCDRFIIPDKLYGREAEVSTLLQAFERVSQGATEMMLVAGFSGIGKTAVVNEVHKPIVRQRGYFIKGKFDQFQRNIPFSAFVQAFRDLMGQLLTESDPQIQHWKNQILSAVGENGQVIIEVIPELETIIGPQPSAPELSGTAAQNRFNLLFQNFTQVFTSAEHPLVMFLDDLQWADSASLKLMQLLMADTSHLLLIGAYRDNEVNPAHPLMLTLSEIQKTVFTINTITLAPLSQVTVTQLVADTLKCRKNLALPLSQLVFQKTKGNPFFATQFLKVLHQEQLIQFTPPAPPYQGGATGGWQCDIAQVKQQAVTDDIVAFMALQLGKMPPSTQQVLQLAACIGNQFDLVTLAIVSEHSEVETASNLWRSLQEGLILPISSSYKFYHGEEQQESAVESENSSKQIAKYSFLHDRVQQAAYSLIPDRQKASIHLNIGQLLLARTSDIEQTNKLFDIVNHLNRGLKLVLEPAEREKIAQLNGLAAKRARSATAYQSAMTYATTGITLLKPDCWQSQYELALMLHELAAENAFLAGELEQMEHWAEIVLQEAKTLLDRVKIYEIEIQNHIFQHQFLDALALAKQVLSQLGIQLPDCPTQEDIQQGFQYTVNLLAGRPIEELLNLPPMTASEPLAAMRIAASAAPGIYNTNPLLYPLLIFSQVNASIQHGNAPFSAFFYVSYGLLLNGILEDMEAAERAGKLALAVIEKLNAKEVECRIRVILGAFVLHGTTHLQMSVPVLRESYQIGLDTGDLEFAGYGAFHSCKIAYFSSQELLTLERDIHVYSQMPKNLKQVQTFNCFQILRQAVLKLLGNAHNSQLLVGDMCDEAQFLPQLLAANDLQGLHFFYLHKLILGYLFGETAQSLSEIATEGRQYLAAGAGIVTVPIFYFYDSLAALTGDCSGDSDLTDRLQRVAENQTKLHKRAHHAPMNYLHKWHLVEAEKCRVLGEKASAIDYYDRAISGAKENGYIQEEALANELAAKFYLDWGKERIAQEYITQAYYGYARWGAKAKVADLERRYRQLLAPILQQTRSPLSTNETIFALGSLTSTIGATSSSSSVSVALDLAAILKAYQTISGEIEFEKLLSSLLSILIENAGANKCVLMLLRDSRLLIKGSITVGTEPVVLQRLPIEECQDIPHKLIYKVKHERRTAVLIDASADPTLANDPYIIRQQPSSILCSPILHQGKLLGILYLENTLVTGAFTSDRVELLNILCAQAAISLENARLYQEAQQMLAELSASKARFQKLVDNVPGMIYQIRLDLDGSVSIPYVSPGCADLYEVPPEEFLTGIRDFRMLEYPDDRPAMTQAFVHSAQTLMPFEQEWRIVTTSGTVKWVQAASRPERQADGSIIWDGVTIDISDRKLAEKSLRLTQFAIDRSSVPVWWVKPSGQISYVNDAACRDLGYSRIEILQKHVWDFNPDLSSEAWKKHWQEVKEQGSCVLETYNFNKSGHCYPVEVTVNYLELDGEEYNCTFVKNISDRQLAEAQLRASQQRLQLLVQQTPLAVIEWDTNFQVTDWNLAAERIFGYTKQEALGRKFTFIIPQSIQAEMELVSIDIISQQGGNYSINENVTKDGKSIICAWYNNPLVNAKGELIGVVSLADDITERQLAEAVIIQKSQELEQALHDLQQTQLQMIQSEKMSALGNLVAGVAHEINNPVGFLTGNLSEAKSTVQDLVEHLNLYRSRAPETEIADHAEDIDLDYIIEDLPKMIDSMQLGCDRIKGISTSLRTFSRADKDYKVAFNIHEGIDSTTLILKYRLKANDERPAIEVVKDYGNIPAIECFPGQLNQVFMNIFANAIDALDESNTGRIFSEIQANPNRITITTSRENHQVKIVIADNGQGMDESVKQKIFDHLFTTKSVGKGTGLGLAIARQIIVEKHGGSLNVNSIMGTGTEFIITLPTKSEQKS